MNVSRVLVMTLVATAAFRVDAHAWGEDGHRIVCRIAFLLLDETRQKKVVDITLAYKTPDGGRFNFFTDACNFPDEARIKARNNLPGWNRFDEFDKWHFLNVPRTTDRVEASHCQDNCVLTGIARHAPVLAKTTDPTELAEALFFVSHWLGDIHQPLHVSYADDLGGNHIQPINGGFYQSGHLHSVWDSGIVGKAISTQGWRIYADRLASRITLVDRVAWLGGSEITWALESYRLATTPLAEYCGWRDVKNVRTCARLGQARTLGAAYQNEFEEYVEMRLQQAGLRLADLLRRNLPDP